MENGKNLNTHFAHGIIMDINAIVEELIKEFKDNYTDSEIDLINFLQNDACDMATDMLLEHFADIYSIEEHAKIYDDLTELVLAKLSGALIFAHGE